MHEVVTLLDRAHDDQVRVYWKLLEKDCGLVWSQSTPYPHFSWHIAQEVAWEVLEPRLEKIVKQFRPFVVYASGISVFTGQTPVIFIPVIRCQVLNKLHAELWKVAQAAGSKVDPKYAPQAWTPHITLAQGSLSGDQIMCALELLARQVINWEIVVNNIAVIDQPAGETGSLRGRFFLSG